MYGFIFFYRKYQVTYYAIHSLIISCSSQNLLFSYKTFFSANNNIKKIKISKLSKIYIYNVNINILELFLKLNDYYIRSKAIYLIHNI